MKISRKGMTAAAALALALWVGSALGAAAQVTTAAATQRADPTAMAYRQALTEEFMTEVESLRPLLLGGAQHEGQMAQYTSRILSTVVMLGALSQPAAGPRAEALVAAAERLDDAARTGDRTVALGHFQILVRNWGLFQASFGTPAARPRTIDATLNVN